MYDLIRSMSKAIVGSGNLTARVLTGTQGKTPTSSRQYGGFVSKDWEKVGLDMKRGLVSYGNRTLH